MATATSAALICSEHGFASHLTGWLFIDLMRSPQACWREFNSDMKRLLLVAIFSALSSAVARADLGPAQIEIPGQSFVNAYTNKEAPVLEAYCAKWRNKCLVEVTDTELVVDKTHRTHRDLLVRIWSNQLHGPGRGIRDFIYVTYLQDDGTRATGQFIFTNMTTAAEFYNRLQLLMSLKN